MSAQAISSRIDAPTSSAAQAASAPCKYTEALIAVVEVLTNDADRNRCVLNGEIVAQCARQRCGYLLCLERFYSLSNLKVHMYEKRDSPLPIQDLIHISDIEKSFRRGDGLFQVMPDIVLRGNRQELDKLSPSSGKAVQAGLWADLMRGMTEDNFWATFVQCLQCEKVTFREHFAVNHHCSTGSATRTERTQSKARHHPYNRDAADGTRPTRPRILVRTETLLADVPEYQPVSSMSSHRPHRASTPESAHNYDPDDVIPALISSSSEGGFESAQEDGFDEGGFDEDHPEAARSDGSAGLWWQHDIPELSSDDDLPDILTILEQAS